MKRAVVQLSYFLRTSLRGLRSSPVTTGVSVVTIGVTLVLVGVFGLLLQNMEKLIEEFGNDLHVTAYFDEGIDADAQRELGAQIAAIAAVERVEIVSSEQALERFRSSVGSGSLLLEGLDENPLPASLEISLLPEEQSAAGLQGVVAAIDGVPGISDLAAGQDWVEGYLRAVSLVRGISAGIGVTLALATILIVANTIRLGIFARRDELEILSLVGASRGFVRTPFLLEGVIQGAVGGCLALGLLFALFHLVVPGLEFGLEMVIGTSPRFFSLNESLMLVGTGAGLGLVGSATALSGGWRP